MKPKITKRQLIATFNLLNDLKNFESKNLGMIIDLKALQNFNFPESIFMRYEKDYMSNGERVYSYNIAEIKQAGSVSFIDKKFETPFQRYSFLGECKIFDINDETDYELID